MKFRTPYNSNTIKSSVEFNDVSLTDQSCKNECDINFIIDNFVRTGELPSPRPMHYYDTTTVQSYEDAMQLVADCKTNFELLPVDERDKFKNVSGWLEYVNNSDNLKDCIDKGYIDRSTVDFDTLDRLYSTKSLSTVNEVASDVKLDKISSETPPNNQ